MANKTELINCLRKERVIVRHINRPSTMVTNPKHILYGGMAENAIRVFVVPKLSSGRYVDVLTKDEKNYLEDLLGLEPEALSIYKKKDNFWDDSNPDSIARVTLHKQDNYLDLSTPEDYIRYKILIANKDFIAPSLEVLELRPKATYQYVIIHEDDEAKSSKSAMDVTMRCYKEYGKIEDDKDILRFIVETLEGRPLSSNTKLEFIQAKINTLIQANPKSFLKVITDKLLPTKVMIKQAIKSGVIVVKGDYLYLREGNKPLCEEGENPTLDVAAKFLNQPKYQELKFLIENKVNQ